MHSSQKNEIRGSAVYMLAFVSLLLALILVSCSSIGLGQDIEQPGGISGRVYLDEDANEVFEECDCDCVMEDVTIQLYPDRCSGQFLQITKTDENGYYLFEDLTPGEYCVMPKVKLICEGYQPTTSITQRVQVVSGEIVEADWFGFDHHFDVNE